MAERVVTDIESILDSSAEVINESETGIDKSAPKECEFESDAQAESSCSTSGYQPIVSSGQNSLDTTTESVEADLDNTVIDAGSLNVDESQSQYDMPGTSDETNNASSADKAKEAIEQEEKPSSIENEEGTKERHPVLLDESHETSDSENVENEVPVAAEDDTDNENDTDRSIESDDLGLGVSLTPSTVTLISSTDSDRMNYMNDILPEERQREARERHREAQERLREAQERHREAQERHRERVRELYEYADFDPSESDSAKEVDTSLSTISGSELNSFENESAKEVDTSLSTISGSELNSFENVNPENESAREIAPEEIIEGEVATISEASLDNESSNLNTDKDKETLQNKPSEEYTETDDKITDLEAIPSNKEINNDSRDSCDNNREISDEVIDSESMKDSLMEVDEASQSTSHKDSGEFIHVNMDIGQDCSSVDKDGSSSMDVDKEKESGEPRVEQDPIGDQDMVVNDSDNLTETDNASEQGADEELCIIPDTERVISQAEKEAASALPKLRDLTETSVTEDTSKDLRADSSTSTEKFFVNRNEGDNDLHTCEICLLKRTAKYTYLKDGITKYICSDECLKSLKNLHPNEIVMSGEGEIRVKDLASCKDQQKMTFVRKCATCHKKTDNPELNLTWEIMDFCNEFCLSKYQREIGSKCSSCSTDVRPSSLGKYCVRFGNDIRQFCTSHCLEEYKKGLKVCSYCQQDMSGGPEGFLAPVGDKGQFKDFCSQVCMEKYDIMTNDRPPKVSASTKCCVCAKEGKSIAIDFFYKDQSNYFCGEPCFVAFSFVNKITAGKCAMCKRNFTRYQLEKFTMFYDNVQYSFCSNSCQNIYIVAHRKIVPCSWCKVKKYNFDMIRRYSQPEEVLNMCSVNCLSLYQVSVNALTSKKVCCDFCMKQSQPMYHLTMSDATIRNFCSYSCCLAFQSQFPKTPITMTNDTPAKIPVVPAGAPRKSKKLPHSDRSDEELSAVPIMSNIQNLANTNGNSVSTMSTRSTRSKSNNLAVTKNISVVNKAMDTAKSIQQIKQQIIVKPYPIPEQRNVATLTRVRTVCKGTNTTKSSMVNKEVQTEKREKDKILIPVPVPIYVPAPLNMYSTPVVYPIPFPLPIPIPIFIPTTRNSSTGIMKEIKKIQVKIPSDPYEAELLMMAEMVADDKKEENTDSESDMDETGADDGHFTPEPVDSTNTFGDDMLQMALKMATELEEPAVDLEGALTANTITAPQGQEPQEHGTEPTEQIHLMERQPVRGRKRGISRGGRAQGGPSKRGRRAGGQEVSLLQPVQQPPPPPEPVEKPDANMCLKYTFGVNAWKQWVTTKNSELEKSSRRLKLFKTEILQLTADELNYSLCLFVKEVRKPNGAEYAPDTIYYLCLGIQQYLFENGRIDNIFCDPYYEKFTDCLDEVARKFSVLYNDSHYIVTRVEEEHLWESKQLGAHSPHVLLSTLMFFNTKHFNLTTVDEHMQLSFSHIMKHWKRNPNQPGASKAPGSRNVLLRFYPPQSALQNNTRKKKVYEQQENEENPLRCPVKLYEFYLSKCPESVKTRNDVFYLQPERSCVPDSPVWYSTMPLPRESLEKMLHRVKMVKEINVALLTS